MEKFEKKENFESVYRTNRWKVIARISRALNCDKELAEDLSCKVFVKVAKYFGSFDAEKSSFNTWLNMITNSVMIDYKRSKEGKMKFKTAYISDFVDSESNETMQIVNSADTMADVNLGLSELENLLNKTIASFSEIKQKICKMQIQGYQMNEIAEVVNIPENTVKQHIFRFRKEMKELIGNRYQYN